MLRLACRSRAESRSIHIEIVRGYMSRLPYLSFVRLSTCRRVTKLKMRTIRTQLTATSHGISRPSRERSTKLTIRDLLRLQLIRRGLSPLRFLPISDWVFHCISSGEGAALAALLKIWVPNARHKRLRNNGSRLERRSRS
jgi:hypothetical protein